MSQVPPISREQVSQETIRKLCRAADKRGIAEAMYGPLYAEQHVRAIGRLHSFYPGQRTEFDYTKYTVFLYPNADWNLPLPFYTGYGVDHQSRVIKGTACTLTPTRSSIVRLYRRCVLPKSLWLPPNLLSLAQDWDVFGSEEFAVVDNAMDLTSDSTVLMFLSLGAIVLRCPPLRGDMKGTVERTQYTEETTWISGLDGYCPRTKNPLSPEAKELRSKAIRKARHTVADYERMCAEEACEFNHAPHPDLKARRIDVWRDGLVNYPVLLPVGPMQMRTTFALHLVATLTREGVVANELQYNSPALHSLYRKYSGKVRVKQDPDDVRTVLVYADLEREPIEAFLTSHVVHQKVSLEMLKATLVSRNTAGMSPENLALLFPELMNRVLSGEDSSTPAAAQAAAVEDVATTMAPAADVTNATHRVQASVKGAKKALERSRLVDD